MAHFDIIKGPKPGLLYEAAARREEGFKVYFTLAMQPVELTGPLFRARPFRLYAYVDDPRYDYVDYYRILTLRPVLSAQDPVGHLLKMEGAYSLQNQKGRLQTSGSYDNCLPIDWLGLNGHVINPLKRQHLRLVDDVIARFSDWDLCQLYVADSLVPGYAPSNENMADAVRCVTALRARLDVLGLDLSGWRHSENELHAMF